MGSTGWLRRTMSHRGVPLSTSTTPGWATAPLRVTRQVPGLLGHPAGPKRSGTVAGDEGDVGQRLGVVHQGRALLDAEWNALVRTEHR